MKKRKDVIRQQIDSFQKGKFKGYTFEQLCKYFRIDISYAHKKLRAGYTFEEVFLTRTRIACFTETERTDLVLKGVVFNKAKKKSNFKNMIDTFQNGKYKGYTIYDLAKEFHRDGMETIYRLKKGESLESILLNRTLIGNTNLTEKDIADLKSKGVVFNILSKTKKFKRIKPTIENKILKFTTKVRDEAFHNKFNTEFIPQFQNGKYKDYDFYSFCKLFHTDKSTLKKLLLSKQMKEVNDYVLVRPGTRLNKETRNTLSQLGVKFLCDMNSRKEVVKPVEEVKQDDTSKKLPTRKELIKKIEKNVLKSKDDKNKVIKDNIVKDYANENIFKRIIRAIFNLY